MRAGFLGRYRCLAIDHEHVRGGLGPCATPLVGRASICVHVFRVTSLLELDFLDLRLLWAVDNCLFIRRLIYVSRRAACRLGVMIVLAMGRFDPFSSSLLLSLWTAIGCLQRVWNELGHCLFLASQGDLLHLLMIWVMVIRGAFGGIFSWVVCHEGFLDDIGLHDQDVMLTLTRDSPVRWVILGGPVWIWLLLWVRGPLRDEDFLAGFGAIAPTRSVPSLCHSEHVVRWRWLSICGHSGLGLVFPSHQAYLRCFQRGHIQLLWLHFQVSRFKWEDLYVFPLFDRALIRSHQYITSHSLFRRIVLGRGRIAPNLLIVLTIVSLTTLAGPCWAIWIHIMGWGRVHHIVLGGGGDGEGGRIWNRHGALVGYFDFVMLLRMSLLVTTWLVILFEEHRLCNPYRMAWMIVIRGRYAEIASNPQWFFLLLLLLSTHDIASLLSLTIVMTCEKWAMELTPLMMHHFLGLYNCSIVLITSIIGDCSGCELQLLSAILETAHQFTSYRSCSH